MPAYDFQDLGAISGVGTTNKEAHSKRGRDSDRFQNIMFECDPTRPFTGIIYFQGSLEFPPQNVGIRAKKNDVVHVSWADIARIELNNEAGTFFLQTEIELSMIRIICKDGDYWSAASGTAGATVGANGSFTINGIGPIAVSLGDNATAVANAINTHADIITDGTIVADVIGDMNNRLRIYKTDGTNLVLANTVGTPLTDMGIPPNTYQAGRISRITTLR